MSRALTSAYREGGPSQSGLPCVLPSAAVGATQPLERDVNASLPVVAGPLTVSPMVILVAGLADDFESRVVGGVNAHITIR